MRCTPLNPVLGGGCGAGAAPPNPAAPRTLLLEGDAPQRDFPNPLGRRSGQGYLFARPMAHADLVRWLAAPRRAPA